MSRQSYSIVKYFADENRHTCGYCKSPDTNYSHGMWAYSLTVQDYQNLIDRGWRRSGYYCYKPTMNLTCCPMYTIKCEALNFKISKSQKKNLKKMAKFLRNELKKEDLMDMEEQDEHDNLDPNAGEIPNYKKYFLRAAQNASKVNVSSIDSELNGRLHSNVSNIEMTDSESKTGEKNIESNNSVSHPVKDSRLGMQVSGNDDIDTIQTPCKKAKLLRIERKQKKLLAQGKSMKEIEAMFKERKQQNIVKSLEDLFDEVYSGTSKLELKLVRTSPMSSGYLKTSKKTYEIYKKYQTTIHAVPAEKVTEQRYTRFLVKSPLQMKLVRVLSEEFLSTLDASADLYKKYQMTIHEDLPEECDKKSFLNFLVKSPLQPWTPDDGPPQGYGSFHEQYWLNNELIAVAVIDILPSCISSVYFFYDPEYSHLSLGTFSSLREVCLTRQLNKVAKDLKYYYMGFYIHTCPKMRYKARMKPSFLLCPETYKWFDIDPCMKKLDKEKYSRLNDDTDAIDEDGIVDIRKAIVLYHETAMPYMIYKLQSRMVITKEKEEEIEEYASLVGMKCAQSLLLCRD